MKREIAAITFSALLAGAALAGPIESSELPPPAPSAAPESALRGPVGDTRNHGHQAAKASLISSEDLTPYSAELWLEGIPEPDRISLDALAQKIQRYPGYRPVESRKASIPTSLDWNYGNWKANLGASITTATAQPTVIPVEAYAGSISASGGTGAIDGRIEYDLKTWQFYGGTKHSVIANPDGTIAVNDNFLGGTYYKLPPSLLGGKLGTGFEVNPASDAKTRLEYRRTFGDLEGFLAAERTTPFQHNPDAPSVNALKAGINRKF